MRYRHHTVIDLLVFGVSANHRHESLDFNVVRQDTIDNARRLTDARYGVIATAKDAGRLSEIAEGEGGQA